MSKEINMPIFACSNPKCKAVENTATSNYWIRKKGSRPLCSACDPEIGKWHGLFPKEKAEGKYIENKDGFLEPPGGWK